jgi:uncharacterized metal-binding protein YceD (DUF177 family)
MSNLHPAAVQAAEKLRRISDDLNDIDAGRIVHSAIEEHLQERGYMELVAAVEGALFELHSRRCESEYSHPVECLKQALRRVRAEDG